MESFNLYSNQIFQYLPRLQITKILSQNANLTISELAEIINMTPGNAFSHCASLIKAGYIIKEQKIIESQLKTVYSTSIAGEKELLKYSNLLIEFLRSDSIATEKLLQKINNLSESNLSYLEDPEGNKFLISSF